MNTHTIMDTPEGECLREPQSEHSSLTKSEEEIIEEIRRIRWAFHTGDSRIEAINTLSNKVASALRDARAAQGGKLAFTFEDHCALMDAKHPDWRTCRGSATSYTAVAREFWDAAIASGREVSPVTETSRLPESGEAP